MKMKYTTPSVEIAHWKTEDVIRTSGVTLTAKESSIVASVGDDNVTCSVNASELK